MGKLPLEEKALKNYILLYVQKNYVVATLCFCATQPCNSLKKLKNTGLFRSLKIQKEGSILEIAKHLTTDPICRPQKFDHLTFN